MGEIKYQLSRDLSRKIKGSKRKDLEAFLERLYNNGFKAGLEAAENKRNIPFDAKQLSAILLDDVKGISVEKAEEIIKVLTDKYELQQQEDK